MHGVLLRCVHCLFSCYESFVLSNIEHRRTVRIREVRGVPAIGVSHFAGAFAFRACPPSVVLTL